MTFMIWEDSRRNNRYQFTNLAPLQLLCLQNIHTLHCQCLAELIHESLFMRLPVWKRLAEPQRRPMEDYNGRYTHLAPLRHKTPNEEGKIGGSTYPCRSLGSQPWMKPEALGVLANWYSASLSQPATQKREV